MTVPGCQRGQAVQEAVLGQRAVLGHDGFEMKQPSVLFNVQEEFEKGGAIGRIVQSLVVESVHAQQRGARQFPLVYLAGGDPRQGPLPAASVLARRRSGGEIPIPQLPVETNLLLSLGLALLKTIPGPVFPAPGLVGLDRAQTEGGNMRLEFGVLPMPVRGLPRHGQFLSALGEGLVQAGVEPVFPAPGPVGFDRSHVERSHVAAHGGTETRVGMEVGFGHVQPDV